MNGFTKKSVGTLTLGEKLKKLRSDKRISLGEVSRSTKIQAAYLEHLEEGSYDKLPADVYVRGFLRSYADFLGVDERIMLKLYDKEKGIKKNLDKDRASKVKEKKPIDISSFVFTPQKIIIAAVTILVLTGLFFLYREVNSFASAPSLVILSPNDNSEVKDNSVYVKGVTEKDAALFINGQPILVGEDGAFGENLTLQSGLNTISVKAVNKFQKEVVKNIVMKSDYVDNAQAPPGNDQSSASSDNPSPDAATTGVQIDLRVDPGPVWLSVETDGTLAFSGTMLSGSVQSFKAQDKIVISSGNGKATFVKMNGQDMGALSADEGAVKNAIFTKDTAPNAATINPTSPATPTATVNTDASSTNPTKSVKKK